MCEEEERRRDCGTPGDAPHGPQASGQAGDLSGQLAALEEQVAMLTHEVAETRIANELRWYGLFQAVDTACDHPAKTCAWPAGGAAEQQREMIQPELMSGAERRRWEHHLALLATGQQLRASPR